MVGRKLLTIQPLNGKIWYGFNTPATNVNSFPLFINELLSIPVGDTIPVYIISDAGSVNVVISEMK
jgi:hypothetical protein